LSDMKLRALSAVVCFLSIGVAAPLTAIEIGGTAQDFSRASIDGKRFSLMQAEKEHSAVAVLFVSTLCPYSNYYNDLLRDMAAEYSRKGVLFVGINSSRVETSEEIVAHARQHGHNFPILQDADGKLAAIFDARRTPEVFLLDHEGKLRYHGRIASKISSPDLKNALDSLLAGRPIRPAETKAFGCAIQRD
jgi:peroxiredoxin